MTEKLLIIDDDPNLLMGLKRVFIKSGYSVWTARNGKEGLERIYAQAPDIVLCDIMMPPPNGLELKKIINEDPDLRQVPFIFLTARSTKADVLNGYSNLEVDDYITKPFDVDILLAQVKNTLQRNKSRQIKSKSQEEEINSRIRALSKKLEELNKISELVLSHESPEQALYQAVEMFAGSYHPQIIEFWSLNEQSQKFEFETGFTVNPAGDRNELVKMAEPVQSSPDSGCCEHQMLWTPPIETRYGQKVLIKIYDNTSERHDSIIGPAYVRAFLNQISLILQKRDSIGQIEHLKETNERHILSILKGLIKALELRDHETSEHCERVAKLSQMFALELNLPGIDLESLYLGAYFHDIGKIGIPDQILQKKGPLTGEERHIMCQHPIYGYELLSKFDYLKPALKIPLYHHERWDGGGYPYGISGEEIPIEARIFSIVDVWDSMSYARVYRPALSNEVVSSYLKQESGKSFQPELIDAFIDLMRSNPGSAGASI